MPSLQSLALAAAALPVAFAHYNFESLIVNGKASEPYQHVRRTTNANSPIEDVTSPDIVCNQGGNDADIRAATETMEVAAGDEIGFDINSELGHPGPLYVYMSKAPEGVALSDYEGDGDWFKVYALTTSDISADMGLSWASFKNGGAHNFTFTLPEDLPSGDYLLRGEHIGLHGAGSPNGAQFYIGCAQISVTGGGSGTPGPMVQLPGAFTPEDPGLLLNLYWPPPTEYISPGPAVWPGECEDHTINHWDQESDGDCNAMGGGPAPEQPTTPEQPETPEEPSTPEPTTPTTPVETPSTPAPEETQDATEPTEPVEEEEVEEDDCEEIPDDELPEEEEDVEAEDDEDDCEEIPEDELPEEEDVEEEDDCEDIPEDELAEYE